MLSEVSRGKSPARSPEEHAGEAMDWLLRAHDRTGNKGVSQGFHFYHGWLPAYPETTGYIIETFYGYADRSGRPGFKECAQSMADWLCTVQEDDGSIPGVTLREGLVFDTGQVLFGLCEASRRTGNAGYRDAATRAADWITARQEADGSWVKNAHNGIPHTYYSRVAWGLLQVHSLVPEGRYVDSCRRNIDWCLAQQDPGGWFDQASFLARNHGRPYSHTLAYTARGILEAGIALGEDRYVAAARKTADGLAVSVGPDGFVPGRIDSSFNGPSAYACLTGSAQFALLYLRLHEILGHDEYLHLASRITGYLTARHDTVSNNADLRGGVAGSYPAWGEYSRCMYPNWAAKFFVDALLLQETAVTP